VLELHAFKSNRRKLLRDCRLTRFAFNVSDDLQPLRLLPRTEDGQFCPVSWKNFSRQFGVVDADAQARIERPMRLRVAHCSYNFRRDNFNKIPSERL
jgi:hypothetical protein